MPRSSTNTDNRKKIMPSDTVKYSAKGFGQTNLTEKLPTYNRGEGERTLVHKNGSLIVLALMKKESQDFTFKLKLDM